jgi:hypothetical protein
MLATLYIVAPGKAVPLTWLPIFTRSKRMAVIPVMFFSRARYWRVKTSFSNCRNHYGDDREATAVDELSSVESSPFGHSLVV